jgi:hypothetical protein
VPAQKNISTGDSWLGREIVLFCFGTSRTKNAVAGCAKLCNDCRRVLVAQAEAYATENFSTGKYQLNDGIVLFAGL